jgi:hypothetical protein
MVMVPQPSSGPPFGLAGQGRIKRLWREIVAQGVTVGLVLLVPLGYASPPDPIWIGGGYDDADYDDVVRLSVGDIRATPAWSPGAGAPVG